MMLVAHSNWEAEDWGQVHHIHSKESNRWPGDGRVTKLSIQRVRPRKARSHSSSHRQHDLGHLLQPPEETLAISHQQQRYLKKHEHDPLRDLYILYQTSHPHRPFLISLCVLQEPSALLSRYLAFLLPRHIHPSGTSTPAPLIMSSAIPAIS